MNSETFGVYTNLLRMTIVLLIDRFSNHILLLMKYD